MRIAIEHTSRYRYDAPASGSVQSLRLAPQSFDGHKVVTWTVACRPDYPLRQGRDGFGNITHLVVANPPHHEVEIVATGLVDTEDRAGVVQGLAETVPLRVFLRRTPLTEAGESIAALVDRLPRGETVAWLHALMAAIRGRVDYRTGVTDTATTAQEAFAAGHGVCQDHAHIFIAAARHAGLPARYVTGYLLIDGSEPSVAHHAWSEIWVDGLGWVGFDVANLLCPTDRYVRLAAGLDALHAAPILGTRRGGTGERLTVEVRVQQSAGQQ